MRSTPENITIPLILRRGEITFVGWVCMAFGLFLDALLIGTARESVPMLLFKMPWALGFTAAGLHLILVCRMRLHLVPEGVAVSLFGRTLTRYPIEKLTAHSWTLHTLDHQGEKRLFLSRLSVEELAALRERKLRASWYYRGNVDCRKHREGWQEEFACEMLKEKSWLGFSLPVRRYGLMLENTPELRALLKMEYPCLRWKTYRDIPPVCRTLSNTRKTRTEQPGEFARFHENVTENVGSWVLLGYSIFLPLLFLMLGMLAFGDSEAVLIVLCGISLVWMFGSLFWYGQVSTLYLREQGICVRTKMHQDRLIPLESIQTAWRFSLSTRFEVLPYLMICPHSMEEMAQMEEKRMAKTRLGREELSALRHLDCWPELAVRRYLRRRAQIWGYYDSGFLLVGYTPQREQWLMECYPHLQVRVLGD